MWLKDPAQYFCKIENSAYGKINKQSFRNPHPSEGLDNIYLGKKRYF